MSYATEQQRRDKSFNALLLNVTLPGYRYPCSRLYRGRLAFRDTTASHLSRFPGTEQEKIAFTISGQWRVKNRAGYRVPASGYFRPDPDPH
jgi:hypothetical protein